VWKIFIFASLVVFALSGSAFAQTVQEAKEQAEIEKAKAEAAASKAAAKKSELDLQQAEEKARLDLQSTQDKVDDAKRKALTESIAAVNSLKADAKDVSVSGNAIETKALANRAVTKVAEQLATMIPVAVCGSMTTVILADDQAIGSLPNYDAGILTLTTLAKSYKGLIKNAQKSFDDLKVMHDRKEKSLLAAVPALLQGVAAVGAVAQTFRTQLTVAGEDVTIDQLAVYGALAGIWTKKCAASTLTAYPNLGKDFASSGAAKLLEEVVSLLATALDLESEIALWLIPNKAALAKELAAIDAAQKAAALKPAAVAPKPGAEGPKPPADKPAPEAPKPMAPTAEQKAAAEARKSAIAEIEAVLAKLKTADQRVDQTIQQLVATSEKQPVSPIAQLARVERFATAIRSANAYVLTIKAVAGGGNTVTTNNFWRGPKVFHSGGAVLAYTLIGADGAYVGGGVLDSHQGYVQLDIAEKKSLGNSWDADVKPPAIP
jgi:hypothetical protein